MQAMIRTTLPPAGYQPPIRSPPDGLKYLAHFRRRCDADGSICVHDGEPFNFFGLRFVVQTGRSSGW